MTTKDKNDSVGGLRTVTKPNAKQIAKICVVNTGKFRMFQGYSFLMNQVDCVNSNSEAQQHYSCENDEESNAGSCFDRARSDNMKFAGLFVENYWNWVS
jgi:hypothetical protein